MEHSLGTTAEVVFSQMYKDGARLRRSTLRCMYKEGYRHQVSGLGRRTTGRICVSSGIAVRPSQGAWRAQGVARSKLPEA